MQMLDGSKLRGFLGNVNPRMEKHGKENILAADLKITIDFSNDVLDRIEPGLLAALYRKPTKSEAGDLFDGTDSAPGPRVLRFPKIGALSYENDFPGYSMVVHRGVTGDNDIALDGVTIDKMQFDAKEGGTVALSFRAVIHPDVEKGHLDALCALIQSEIDVTLTPPAPPTQQELDAAAAKTSGKAIDGTK